MTSTSPTPSPLASRGLPWHDACAPDMRGDEHVQRPPGGRDPRLCPHQPVTGDKSGTMWIENGVMVLLVHAADCPTTWLSMNG
jgi:hypothetical protein